ncbi:MAG: hypothetical protein RLZZ508_1273 [Actinomycetota bacterium]
MNKNVTIDFLGAARTVTGSKFLVQSSGATVLFDSGLFQGLKELRLKNWQEFPVPPSSIDAIVITHAHLDHCGYLPALVRDGFNGSIYMTTWTAKLAAVVLRDSAKLQTEDAEYAARKGYSKHKQPKPLYSIEDAERTIAMFKVVDFRKTVEVATGFSVTFYPCGHILGAAFLDVNVDGKRLLISGDMGRPQHPILNPPDNIPSGEFDAFIVESTYGDRDHEPPASEFADAINRTINRGGSVLIPAFAVDRTEVILMEVKRLMDEQTIKRVPVYVDSPMALTTLDYYRDALVAKSEDIRMDVATDYETHDLFDPGTLHELRTVEASKSINKPSSPCIIISASGMATGGRVVHHLEMMLPNPKHTVLMVGFQAAGTRGRQLVEGAKSLKMYGQYVPVRMEVVQVGSFSVHADRKEMIEWLKTSDTKPKVIYVVHGEESAAMNFRDAIADELNLLAVVPNDQEHVVL